MRSYEKNIEYFGDIDIITYKDFYKAKPIKDPWVVKPQEDT